MGKRLRGGPGGGECGASLRLSRNHKYGSAIQKYVGTKIPLHRTKNGKIPREGCHPKVGLVMIL